jgi:hypothetical protein
MVVLAGFLVHQKITRGRDALERRSAAMTFGAYAHRAFESVEARGARRTSAALRTIALAPNSVEAFVL